MHFLDDDVKILSKADIINLYGGILLLETDGHYFLGKSHWAEGYVAEPISKNLADAFKKEFGEV